MSQAQWLQVTPNTTLESAPWLKPGKNYWGARLDPAETKGEQWYVISLNGDRNKTLRAPAKWVSAHVTVVNRDKRPSATVLGKLTTTREKSTQAVIDKIMNKAYIAMLQATS